MPTTILDACVDHFKQLVIVISGMSGSNKTEIAHILTNILNCKHINQDDYLNQDHKETVTINNKKIMIWDSDDAIDWKKFNLAIEEILQENKIIVISGTNFNKEKINFKIDFHIHLKLSKQKLLEKRHEFINKHADDPKYADNLKLLDNDEQTEKQLMNQVTYPYYLKVIENSMINKFLNANETTEEEISKEVFQLVIKYIEHRLYKNRSDLKWDSVKQMYIDV
jgi:adenylate kinase family enzyme